jgi:phospholipid/cholesterol/gamma-HCH transport system substrate-binding protein
MNISNETKVGALTAVAIVLLILGFNFLKGKSLTTKTTRYYAVFENIQGLVSSNAVLINGKQIGNVYNTSSDNDMRRITVAINLNQPVHIPANSISVINTSILGVTTLEILLGDDTRMLTPGDTIKSRLSGGLLDAALQRVDPVLFQIKNAVHSLDSVLSTVNGIFDPNTKNNIRSVIDNLNKTTGSLTVSSASLQSLLNTQTGALAASLNNVSSFTGNLAKNNEKLSSILTNVDKTTTHLSNLDLEKTLTTLNGTISDLKNTISKLNSKDGSLGLMLNDKNLYSNLNATSNKLNLLIDDLRLHPKRYVNISVFGKKDRSDPLTTPLPDTVNAPYIRK